MDMKGWIFVGLGVIALLVATWFLSAWQTHKSDVAEFAQAPRETTYVAVLDTVWREVVKIRTLHQTRHETLWVDTRPGIDSLLYVIAADTANAKFSLHVEYAQPQPLGDGWFQNVKVDIRDSIRTVTVTQTQVEIVNEFPLWQSIAIGSVTFGLGVWLGSR